MTPTTLPIALLPDSEDSRALVELTSHATDLSEAAHTLGYACDAGEDSELWLPLTMHAVTAYVRPFIHSEVRTRLDHLGTFPGLPSELGPLHATIRKYRNTTVAHSQSDLVLPLAIAHLSDRGTVRDVFGSTYVQPMPGAIAEQFAHLVATLEGIVEEMTEPVLDRLREKYRATSAETIAAWPPPAFHAALDTEFTGARSRTGAPQMTLHWHVDREEEESDEPRYQADRG